MKIPFTLDAWLKDKNQKIVTESNLPVEIIHIEDDCADELPIIAMIGDKPRRIVQAYSTDGEPENEIGDLYLFIVTEPEWQKDKMLEGAVEGKVFMSFAPGHNQMVMADVDLPTNTKVKVIIVKEDK